MTTRLLRSALPAFLLIAAVKTPPIHAQGVFDMGILTNTLSMDAVRQSEEERANDLRRRGIREGTAAAAPHGSSGPVALPASAFTYRIDPALHRRDSAAFVSALKGSNAQLGSAIEQELQAHDSNAIAAQYAHRYGLSIDNLADVATMYLAASWFVSRGSEGDPTPAQMRGLRTQLATAFARVPQFAKLTNQDKQRLADSMVLESVCDAILLQSARGKPDQLRAVASSAAEGARQRIHFVVTRFVLTDGGFVAKH